MREKKNKKGYSSRVEKYSTKNRLKRRIKKNIKNLPKRLIKNAVYLFVGIMYTLYLIIRVFDSLIAKLFMKLPRWSRAIILWSLILSNVYHNFDVKSIINKVELKSSIKTTEEIPQSTSTIPEENISIETKQEKEYKCTLEHETACKIQKKALEIGMTEEQTLISIAISKWETGNWSSVAFIQKNNVGGMMCSSGLITYSSLDEGISAFVSNLKRNYFDIGLTTLELIQKKYCPIGAKNDPTGLNKNWLNGTKKMYEELIK